MIQMPQTQKQFRRFVYECLDRAEAIYDIDFGRVTITFDLRGEKAAQAIQMPHPTVGATYHLRFNKEALRLGWDEMVNSTIPHEVAHLVAFAMPSLGASTTHNENWQRIAIALGDTNRGAIYHSLALTPARRIMKFFYENDNGATVEVSARLHRRVQTGTVAIAADRERFYKQHFQHAAIAG